MFRAMRFLHNAAGSVGMKPPVCFRLALMLPVISPSVLVTRVNTTAFLPACESRSHRDRVCVSIRYLIFKQSVELTKTVNDSS